MVILLNIPRGRAEEAISSHGLVLTQGEEGESPSVQFYDHQQTNSKRNTVCLGWVILMHPEYISCSDKFYPVTLDKLFEARSVAISVY